MAGDGVVGVSLRFCRERATNPAAAHQNLAENFCFIINSIMATVLYAEDNDDDALIFRMALKRSGLAHTLHRVDDGEVAIGWLRGDGGFADRVRHPMPDLLILDLKMPKKSGFDVLHWINQTEEFKKI